MTTAVRSPLAARIFAVVGLTAAVVGGMASIVVRLVTDAPITTNTFGLGDGSMIGFVVLGITWATVGALLVVRRPDNAVGRYMVVIGVGYALSMLTAAMTFLSVASDQDGSRWETRVLAWLTVALSTLGTLAFLLGFIFPTGRGHTPRWDRARRVMLYGFLVGGAILALQPGSLHLFPGIENPFGFGPPLRRPDEPVAPFALVSVIVLVPIVVFAVVSRYRQADHIERAQLKWYILSTSVSLGGITLAGLGVAIRNGPADQVGLLVFTWAGALVPVAIGIAILQHRLYDIDRIVSRTIAYAIVSAILAVVLGGGIVLLSAALATYTQGQTIAVAASTLAAFAVFQPVLHRVRRYVDRRFNRTRYDAEQTVADFSARLREEVDIATVTTDLHATVRGAVNPTSLGLWIRPPGRRGTA